MLEKIYPDYLQSLLSGNHSSCHTLVRQVLDSDLSIRDIYVHLFQRSLYEVGELWEKNKISVATEHLATAITERMMAEAYPYLFSQSHKDKSAVVACPTEEHHQIGAQMVADIFELNGWNGYFLGSNTPQNDLLKMIDEKNPDVLALSMSLSFHLPRLLEVISEVSGLYPDLPVWVGGQAFRWGGSDALKPFKNVQFLNDLNTLESILKE